MCRRFRTLCSFFIGGVSRKNNWDKIARVFIQVKVSHKNSLSQLEGEEGGGACLNRGTGCGGQTHQEEACSKYVREKWPCVRARKGPWDGSDGTIMFQEAVSFLLACAEEVSRICLRSGHLLYSCCVGAFPVQ